MRELALVAVHRPEYDRVVFIASTEKDREILRKMRVVHGEVLHVPVKLKRHGKHHRLVFSMMEFIFENQQMYSDIDSLREALTLKTSFVRRFRTLGGRWEKRAVSWSYASLDESDFSRLHSELIDVVLTLLWPGQTKEWLRDSVEQYAFENRLLGFS